MPAANEQQIAKIMGKPVIVPHKMIWRDDDISCLTNVEEFIKVDEVFKRYGFDHTIAVICKDLGSNANLVDYIRSNDHLKLQVHCWNHKELPGNKSLASDLSDCIKMLEMLFLATPTVLYPPWNKTDDKVRKIAADVGLEVKEEKLSLQQYIRVKGHVKEDTVNFHYWSYEDVLHLDAALATYQEMGWNNR